MELQLSRALLGLLGVQVEVSQETLSLGGFGAGPSPSFVGSKSWVWVAKGLPPSNGGGGIIAVGCRLLSSLHRGKLRSTPASSTSYVFEHLAAGLRPALCAKATWLLCPGRSTGLHVPADVGRDSRDIPQPAGPKANGGRNGAFCDMAGKPLPLTEERHELLDRNYGGMEPAKEQSTAGTITVGRHQRARLGNTAQGPRDGVAWCRATAKQSKRSPLEARSTPFISVGPNEPLHFDPAERGPEASG